MFAKFVEVTPWGEAIKNKVEQNIQRKVQGAEISWNIAGGFNDIIGAWINEVLEFTGLDKKIRSRN